MEAPLLQGSEIDKVEKKKANDDEECGVVVEDMPPAVINQLDVAQMHLQIAVPNRYSILLEKETDKVKAMCLLVDSD